MDANQLVLGYWAIRGLGQPLRALLHYVGLPFTDKLYTDANEWFGKDRPAFNSPLANLPYLKDGDKVVFESDAIFYYIAHKANRPELVGKDGEQQVRLAVARGVINDFKMRFIGAVYDEKLAEQKEQVVKDCQEYFEVLEFILSTSKYLAGDNLTYIDFVLWEYIDEFFVFSPETLQNLKRVNELHKEISEIPQIAQYLASESYIKRPFNGPTAAFS